MAFDITFGGVALSGVAPLARVLSFDTDDGEADIAQLDPAFRRGALFVRKRLRPRTISISLILGGATYTAREAELSAINAWAHSDDVKALTATHIAGYHYDALCTAYGLYTGNDADAKITLTFTAFAPEKIGDTPFTGAAGTTLNVGGKLPTWIDLTAVLASQSSGLTWTVGGIALTLSGTIPAGTIAIGSERGRITHTDGGGAVTSLKSMLTYDSKFWLLAPGSYFAAGTVGTFTWKERFF